VLPAGHGKPAITFSAFLTTVRGSFFPESAKTAVIASE
jgi:hypothetical protein